MISEQEFYVNTSFNSLNEGYYKFAHKRMWT